LAVLWAVVMSADRATLRPDRPVWNIDMRLYL
jgi:hypothetical protein